MAPSFFYNPVGCELEELPGLLEHNWFHSFGWVPWLVKSEDPVEEGLARHGGIPDSFVKAK